MEYRLINFEKGGPGACIYHSIEEVIVAWASTPGEFGIQASVDGINWNDWPLAQVKNAVLSMLKTPPVRSHNVGASDYSKHKIQPWDIWMEYHLNPWDADIVKRILRTKSTDSRKLDYEKIIHICQERIRQIDEGYEF